ncbi:hypothetical protein [Mesorhizobium sp. B2-1-3A]|uniref:hypothetical protein n=1 Tax=Mesorhizobium sp. B2-1-3A TaxID=2589971 RepID=UPI001127C6A0|nr:hypothetical protein [Mesorhizobium sp. B2-1-3A]TPM90145.1 hypothetical protein FJ977_34690 [Mesorhizobium sp. B2-1-3A]
MNFLLRHSGILLNNPATSRGDIPGDEMQYFFRTEKQNTLLTYFYKRTDPAHLTGREGQPHHRLLVHKHFPGTPAWAHGDRLRGSRHQKGV